MNEIMAYSSARRVGLSALGLKRIGSSLMPSGLCCLLGALICSDFIVALWSSWFAKVNIIVEGEAAAEIPEVPTGLFAQRASLERGLFREGERAAAVGPGVRARASLSADRPAPSALTLEGVLAYQDQDLPLDLC